jgi:hypothetical protein
VGYGAGKAGVGWVTLSDICGGAIARSKGFGAVDVLIMNTSGQLASTRYGCKCRQWQWLPAVRRMGLQPAP